MTLGIYHNYFEPDKATSLAVSVYTAARFYNNARKSVTAAQRRNFTSIATTQKFAKITQSRR